MKETDYKCTQCGGDAYIGMSNLRGPEGVIIKKRERLCMSCCKKRSGINFFQAQKEKE